MFSSYLQCGYVHLGTTVTSAGRVPVERDEAAEAPDSAGSALQADSQASDSSRVSGRQVGTELNMIGAIESNSGTST